MLHSPLKPACRPLQSVEPGRWLAAADEEGTLRVLEPSTSDQPPAAAVVASWGAHSNSIFDVSWAKVGRRQLLVACSPSSNCTDVVACRSPDSSG
jgi:hypothetical protein